tara:strand:- start:2766 stop:3005 length:240 start_codon:yes stop_codon:yes gene_type:complete
MSVKEQRLKLINEVSLKKGYTFGDMNPFFVEVNELMDKIEAKTMKEYMKKLKIERNKYEQTIKNRLYGQRYGRGVQEKT